MQATEAHDPETKGLRAETSACSCSYEKGLILTSQDVSGTTT